MSKEFTLTSSEGLLVAITNKQKLKQLAKLGFIEYPTKFGGGVQVSEGKKNVNHFKRYETMWGMEIKYFIKL